jgi:DNA polymerase-3 subunit epsilon
MSEQTDNQRNRSLELCKRVVTTESFIAEAKEIYGDRYDYSKVEYKNRDHQVTIVCPIHGDFQVYAREHLDGKGCPKCEKGEKFLLKLKEKFGDKFGLDEFVYDSSTMPVTLICPTHGAFSRKPNQILNSTFGCPECAKQVKDDAHQAAVAKKEEKIKAREEFEAQRLNDWLNEREEQRKKRERALKAFQAGKKSHDFFSLFQIYQQIVDEHIDDIRYNAKWREPFIAPYRLTDEEARKLQCYREGDIFYRYPNEAPEDYYREAFEKDYAIYGRTFEETLSHRSCIILFEGNDLIIKEESYEHYLEQFGKTPEQVIKNNTKLELPTSFVGIDFETLYSQRVSACSIGMVKYKDGKIVDRYYSLIRPPFDYEGKSGKALTWVHGISEDMLVNEKTFAELLPEIEGFAEGLPLVAHNASVEKCCIRDACAYYGIETILDYNNIIDTLPLSREAETKTGKVIEGQGTHSLDAVCNRFGVEVKNHHNALDDAEMCGGLMNAFYKILVENDMPTLLQEKAPNEEGTKRKPVENKQDVAIENKSSNSGCLGILLFAIILTFVFI